MLREKWLESAGTSLTATGLTHVHAIGVLLDPRPRRKACCPCLDWSERRSHLAVDAGQVMLSLFSQQGWRTRTPGYRNVTVTDSGKTALCLHLP